MEKYYQVQRRSEQRGTGTEHGTGGYRKYNIDRFWTYKQDSHGQAESTEYENSSMRIAKE